MADAIYDLCVVGAGLIGSAAASHASQWGRVCLVGPKEPEERNVHDNRDIYGCHYDEGRITRCTDTDPVWALLAQQSINRYKTLETNTGISFYSEVGCLMSGEHHSEYLNKVENVVKTQNLETDYLNFKTLQDKFPYLNVSNVDAAVYEFKSAGYISPRKLVGAQIKQMKLNGGRVVHDVANAVSRIVINGEYYMRVSTETNVQILAKKVLVATGAFTGFRNLLPSNLDLDVGLCPLTVAKVEISEADARNIRTMPTMIYSGKGADDWTKDFPRDNGVVSWYMLPPIQYPDGKYYIKLGHFHNTSPGRFTTSKEVKEWFCCGGDQSLVDSTAELIKNIVKGVTMISYHGDWCVITETPTDRPYIDTIHSQLGVAVGGNGYAAKSSDEIGRLAAAMMLKNQWDSSIPKEVFQVKFKTSPSKL